MVLIPGNINSSLTLNNPTSAASNRLFTLGQILTANIQPIKANQVQITIGNQSFVASTKQPITEAGTVQVRVKQLTPEIQLSIVRADQGTGKQSASQQVVQAAYRQFIPSQAPLSQTFQQINLLQSLPPAIQAPLKTLINQISKQEQSFDGKTVKDKFLNSGLFMESKLKHTPSTTVKAALQADIKAQLLSLQQQAQQLQATSQSTTLSKLSQLLTQALSKLTVQQIQLYENPNMTPMTWLDQKPHRVEENHVEIHKNKQADETFWEVYIDLNLNQGQFSSKLRMSEENNQLSCYIWCETEALKQAVEQKIERLEKQFIHQGLELKNIQVIPNKPEKSKQSVKVALIDIKV